MLNCNAMIKWNHSTVIDNVQNLKMTVSAEEYFLDMSQTAAICGIYVEQGCNAGNCYKMYRFVSEGFRIFEVKKSSFIL